MQTKNIIITLLLLAFAGLLTYTVLSNNRDNERQPSTEESVTNGDELEGETGQENKGISIGEAADIAIEKYGGTIKEVKSDHYHGREAWEVEIENSNLGRIEVKVDKETGEILEVEQD